MKLASTILTAAVAALSLASVAGAQDFNFSTMGKFSGGGPGCNTGIALTVSCSGPGTPLLTFNGVNDVPGGFGSGSQIVLGSFTPTGSGTATVPEGAITFTLYVTQSFPNGGTGTFAGELSGTITRANPGNFSNLVWTPNQNITISPVNYTLEFSQGVNGITIGAVNPTSINGIATTVPEPSTYALMAAGLAGLGMVSRRRRTA